MEARRREGKVEMDVGWSLTRRTKHGGSSASWVEAKSVRFRSLKASKRAQHDERPITPCQIHNIGC